MSVNASIAAELQKAGPSAVIELFELQLVQSLHGSADVYRFHAGTNGLNVSVTWAGNNYRRYPVEATGFEYTGNGQLPRPTLRVANVDSLISAVLIVVNTANPGNDLTGAKLTRIRTMARFLDAVNFDGGTNPYGTPDPTAEFPREVYYIDRKAVESRDIVEFELSSALDLAGVRAPKRQTIANVCQWVYRSAECGYNGSNYYDVNDQPVGSLALDVCGKRLNSCKRRFGYVGNLSPVNPFLYRPNTYESQQFLISPNGWYKAGTIADGRLAIIAKNGDIIWTNGVQPGGATRMTVEPDGNFTVRLTANNQVLWESNTIGSAGHTLAMTATGNLALFSQDLSQVLWQSNSSQGTAEPVTSSPALPFGSYPAVGGFS